MLGDDSESYPSFVRYTSWAGSRCIPSDVFLSRGNELNGKEHGRRYGQDNARGPAERKFLGEHLDNNLVTPHSELPTPRSHLSVPHSQLSPLPIHLHPHHGLDSSMIHPEPTGVVKNDLPQSPTPIICLASMLATNHELQGAISARDQSFHRNGNFRMLQTLVFCIRLREQCCLNATATQTNQHGSKKENRDCSPHIQQSGISDRPDRRHRTPREATRTMFAVSQRDLLPTALIPHPRHPHFLLVTPTSEQPERGAPLPTTPSIIQSPFPVYPRYFGIVDNKAVETTANGQCHEQGNRIGCNIQDLSTILPNDSLEPVKSIVWAPDCSSCIFPPLFSATSFTSHPLVIPSLPPDGAPPQKCYVNTTQWKSYDRKVTDTPDVVETIELSPEEWDPSRFTSNLPPMLALHTLGDIEIFPAHHHANRERVDKETVIEALNNLQIRILPAPPVCITLIPIFPTPLSPPFGTLSTPTSSRSSQPAFGRVSLGSVKLCVSSEHDLLRAYLLPNTLPCSPRHSSQRVKVPFTVVVSAPLRTGLYQHLRVKGAVHITANNQHDERKQEAEHDALGIPRPSNRFHLKQPLRLFMHIPIEFGLSCTSLRSFSLSVIILVEPQSLACLERIKLLFFVIPVAPFLGYATSLSSIVVQRGISPEYQLEIIPDCSSTVHGRFIASIRPGNQPVPPISSAAGVQNIQIREYMGKIITNAPSLVQLPVFLAYNSCDKLPTATTHRRDSCGLATKRNVGLLMMEVGRQKGKDYVMKAQTMCIVIEVHSVGFHATSGLVRHHQLLNMPPGTLIQGWRPENGQSSSPGMIFQGYKLERAQTQHTSHYEIAHLLTSAF
ncbi:hypothetical protein PQX77_012471 [Marasmius sp. AFHP31]|nr:hypothetical protein PQX77_012471 [Marasmius sp. AFHP31]